MASQKNDRLRQIVTWWASMSELERQTIYSLTRMLVVSQDPSDAQALGAAARALTQESPNSANATC